MIRAMNIPPSWSMTRRLSSGDEVDYSRTIDHLISPLGTLHRG